MIKQEQEFKTLEIDIGTIADMEVRKGIGNKDKVEKIISLLKQIQKERGITDFSKSFLRNLFIDFSNLSDKSRQRLLKKILSYAKNIKERIRRRKNLIQELHHEKTIKGDLSKLKRYGVDWVYRDCYSIELFYSFL